jgi:hypothetical protein
MTGLPSGPLPSEPVSTTLSPGSPSAPSGPSEPAQVICSAPRMGATTVEVSTNHVAMVSHPDDVLQLVRSAIRAIAG